MREQHARNKATLQRFLDVSNSHDQELMAKTIDEAFHPDARARTPLPTGATGAEVIKEVFAKLHRAFPDLHITIEDVIAEGDKLVSRQKVTGTHQGEYLGVPPTGKTITYDEIFILRFADGRIAETWGVVDVAGQLQQLGLIEI
jgi:steroid delta-isomerase-like uncharacterized protein